MNLLAVLLPDFLNDFQIFLEDFLVEALPNLEALFLNLLLVDVLLDLLCCLRLRFPKFGLMVLTRFWSRGSGVMTGSMRFGRGTGLAGLDGDGCGVTGAGCGMTSGVGLGVGATGVGSGFTTGFGAGAGAGFAVGFTVELDLLNSQSVNAPQRS